MIGLLAFGIPNIAEATKIKGAIITHDNTTLVAHEIELAISTKRPDEMPATLISNGQKVWVPIKDISRLIFTEKWNVVLFLKDGQKHKIKFGWSPIRYKAVDPFRGKLETYKIGTEKTKEVRLDEDYGDLRQDSAGNLFPPDYLYSPYTGEPMKLVPVE